MQRSLAVGKDLEGMGLMYVLNHGRCDWDGETGYFYSERSDRLNQLAPEPFYAEADEDEDGGEAGLSSRSRPGNWTTSARAAGLDAKTPGR